MKLHCLQALRAIAAWLVVTDHALLEISRNDPRNWVTHVAWAMGSTGVYVFFVISGFIMVHTSWDSFGGRAVAASFIRRRVIRIVPLYWLATVAALGFHQVSGTHGASAGWSELIHSLLFIPYADNDGTWAPILPQGWTLNYEMMFYVVFALGLTLPRYIALAVVGTTLCAFSVLAPFCPSKTLAYLASPIVLWFLLGMGLAVVWRWFKLAEPQWLVRSADLVQPFGDASYSTYLVHGLVLTVFFHIWIIISAAPSSVWIVLASLALATMVGRTVYIVVERPTLRMTNKLWKFRYAWQGLTKNRVMLYKRPTTP
jgi:exopolysaccharide production protein ExoZ